MEAPQLEIKFPRSPSLVTNRRSYVQTLGLIPYLSCSPSLLLFVSKGSEGDRMAARRSRRACGWLRTLSDPTRESHAHLEAETKKPVEKGRWRKMGRQWGASSSPSEWACVPWRTLQGGRSHRAEPGSLGWHVYSLAALMTWTSPLTTVSESLRFERGIANIGFVHGILFLF